jgi:hypothetical protein
MELGDTLIILQLIQIGRKLVELRKEIKWKITYCKF